MRLSTRVTVGCMIAILADAALWMALVVAFPTRTGYDMRYWTSFMWRSAGVVAVVFLLNIILYIVEEAREEAARKRNRR